MFRKIIFTCAAFLAVTLSHQTIADTFPTNPPTVDIPANKLVPDGGVTGDILGKGSSGPEWVQAPLPGSGPAGCSVITVTNDPLAADGKDCDYALSGNRFMWGPKAAGVWPSPPVDLRGVPGTNGTNGTNALPPNFTTSAVTLAPTAQATAVLTGTYPNLNIEFGIPQGQQGIQGSGGSGTTTFATALAAGVAPSNSIGNNGDFAWSALSGEVWNKVSGAWVAFGSLTGPQGPAGQGVPTGGTTGQVLAKTSNTNFATGWVSPSGGGGPTALADVVCATDISANLIAAIATNKRVVANPCSGNITQQIVLPSAANVHGAGSSRNGTDANPSAGPVTGTSFRVPSGSLQGQCVFVRHEHGNGMDIGNFNLWGIGTPDRKGICLEGHGNVSEVKSVFVRNMAVGISVTDALSDESAGWYGSGEDIMLENITTCGIEIDGGLNGGGRGHAEQHWRDLDLHDIDGPRFCIRNLQPDSTVVIEDFIMSTDGFEQESVPSRVFISVINSPRIHLVLAKGTIRAGTGDVIIQLDATSTPGHNISVDDVNLGANSVTPSSPIFCDKLIDAPGTADDVSCQDSGKSTWMKNGKVIDQ